MKPRERHGMSKLPEYSIWKAMHKRCSYVKGPGYHRYGGRGIKVCQRWHKFSAFYDDMGARPSDKHSLDRFPNRDGDYEPGNVRWATNTQQCENKDRTLLLEFRGRKQFIKEWASELGITSFGLHQRLKNGWPIERALTERSNRP